MKPCQLSELCNDEAYHTKIQGLYRGWQFYWLPGYQFRGQTKEAWFCWKKTTRYWSCKLDYGQLDHWCPYDGIFALALERSESSEPVSELWTKHADELSPRAIITHGGWRWWCGSGLSESFVYALRDLLINRYAKALAIYQSWPIDPARPYDFKLPEEPKTL